MIFSYDYDDFVQESQWFHRIGLEIGNPDHFWDWYPATIERDGFLKKTHRLILTHDRNPDPSRGPPDVDSAVISTATSTRTGHDDDDDDADLLGHPVVQDHLDATVAELNFSASDGHPHAYEYHIVYSRTYAVPVLYFIGYDSEGLPLGAEQVLLDLQPQLLHHPVRWTTITQEDHPILGVPCFFIHPCQTRALLQELLSPVILADGPTDVKSREPAPPRSLPRLFSWLSLFGPFAGLKLSLTFIQHLQT